MDAEDKDFRRFLFQNNVACQSKIDQQWTAWILAFERLGITGRIDFGDDMDSLTVDNFSQRSKAEQRDWILLAKLAANEALQRLAERDVKALDEGTYW